MVDGTVRELDSEDEWRETFPVVRQLRPHLDEEEFVSRVGRLQVDGYRLFGLFENGADETDEADGAKGADENNDRRGEPTPRAVAGVAVEYNLYDGRHVWIFDLVTDEAHRSSGFGEQLCSWIEEWAADRGCEAVVLSSGLERTDAHRFYEEQRGMKRASYVLQETHPNGHRNRAIGSETGPPHVEQVGTDRRVSVAADRPQIGVTRTIETPSMSIPSRAPLYR